MGDRLVITILIADITEYVRTNTIDTWIKVVLGNPSPDMMK